MYRHVKDYEIKYCDVDAYDKVKISALLSMLLESACLSADELGFGYRFMQPKNIGFILTNWYVELSDEIYLGEKLTVHTWPTKPTHLIFLRDYELFVGDKKVGVATSRFCMVDLSNFKALPVSAVFDNNFFDGYNTERALEFNSRKYPPLSESDRVFSHCVRTCDCDHYFHVNNTKYADILMNAFSIAELKGKFAHSIQLAYIKQCKEGEVIDVCRKCDGEYEYIEGKVWGETRVQMKVAFNEL